jgi:hypothetical protein
VEALNLVFLRWLVTFFALAFTVWWHETGGSFV